MSTTVADPALIRLASEAAPTTPLAVTATEQATGYRGFHVLVPGAPLVEGTRYLLTDGNRCDGASAQAGPSVAFAVGPAAPLPAGSAGTLSVGAARRTTLPVATSDGSCSRDADASAVTIELDLAPAVAPWAGLLVYETLVDGEPWQPQASLPERLPVGATWRGRARDEIYVACDVGPAERALAAGPHEVVMSASLPGTEVRLVSAPVTIDLRCDGAQAGCSSSRAPAGGAVLLVVAALVRRRRTSPARAWGATAPAGPAGRGRVGSRGTR